MAFQLGGSPKQPPPEVKKMKMKLITLAVLALLLCATVPMAVTAAPKDKALLTAPVYTLKSSTKTVGNTVGQITFNPSSGAYSLSAHNLIPTQVYSIGLSDHAPGPGRSLFSAGFYNIAPGSEWGVATDATGKLTVTGTSDFLTRGLIEHGSVVVVDPVPLKAVITEATVATKTTEYGSVYQQGTVVAYCLGGSGHVAQVSITWTAENGNHKTFTMDFPNGGYGNPVKSVYTVDKNYEPDLFGLTSVSITFKDSVGHVATDSAVLQVQS